MGLSPKCYKSTEPVVHAGEGKGIKVLSNGRKSVQVVKKTQMEQRQRCDVIFTLWSQSQNHRNNRNVD